MYRALQAAGQANFSRLPLSDAALREPQFPMTVYGRKAIEMIYDRDQKVAKPPCPTRIPYYPIGLYQMSLSDRMVFHDLGRCGKPLGHDGDHALGGCGCPLWNFDEQRCHCDEPGGNCPGGGSCY